MISQCKKKITIKILEDMNACKDAVKLARKTLPPGGWPVSRFIRAIPHGDWLIWFLWHAKLARIEQIILLACVAARRSLRFVSAGESRPLQAIEAAEAVAQNNTLATRAAAWAAARAVWSAAVVESAAVAAAVVAAAAAAAEAAAVAAAESAVESARTAESAVESARAAAKATTEHLTIATAIRKMMRTERYARAGQPESCNGAEK